MVAFFVNLRRRTQRVSFLIPTTKIARQLVPVVSVNFCFSTQFILLSGLCKSNRLLETLAGMEIVSFLS